jgi:sec-independent protein translocase protein TatB
MLGLGWQEIAFILVLAIVVVGPDRLPELLRFLGRQYGRLRSASEELRRAFMLEADRADAEKRAEALRRRREEARKRAEEVRRRALDSKGGQPDMSDLPGGGPERPTDPGPVAREPAVPAEERP